MKKQQCCPGRPDLQPALELPVARHQNASARGLATEPSRARRVGIGRQQTPRFGGAPIGVLASGRCPGKLIEYGKVRPSARGTSERSWPGRARPLGATINHAFRAFHNRRFARAVLLFALAMAGLMFASTPWATAALSVALTILTLAPLGIIYRRGGRRAFWTGVVLCGWTYLTLSSGPWSSDNIRPRLVTSRMLERAYLWMVPPNRQASNPRFQLRTFDRPPASFEGGLTIEQMNGWQSTSGRQRPEHCRDIRRYETISVCGQCPGSRSAMIGKRVDRLTPRIRATLKGTLALDDRWLPRASRGGRRSGSSTKASHCSPGIDSRRRQSRVALAGQGELRRISAAPRLFFLPQPGRAGPGALAGTPARILR